MTNNLSPFSFVNIKSEVKTSSRLALPLVTSELVYGINSFIATVMVSHLGKAQLAANALSWGIYLVVFLFFLGILSAISILISQSFGAKDDAAISICFKQGFILAILFSIPTTFIMWFSPFILTLAKQQPEVIALAKPLFHSMAISMLPLNLLVAMQQLFFGISKPRFTLYMSFVTIPVEIFFYYVLLFGKLGFPKVGLAGIGYSLAISYTVSALLAWTYLYFSKDTKPYHLFEKWWVANRKFILELLRIGIPLGFSFCSELALFATIAMMMGVLGTTTLAAYQIAYQFLMIVYFVIFGFTQCAMIRAGIEIGKNNRNALKLTVLVNFSISTAITLLFSVVYFFFPHLIISIDIDIHKAELQSLVKEATKFLAILSLFILTDGFRIMYNGAIRSLKDTKFFIFASVTGFWIIAFPAAYLFGFAFKWGGSGIWWGLLIGLFVSGIMLFTRFYYLAKSTDLQALVTRS